MAMRDEVIAAMKDQMAERKFLQIFAGAMPLQHHVRHHACLDAPLEPFT